MLCYVRYIYNFTPRGHTYNTDNLILHNVCVMLQNLLYAKKTNNCATLYTVYIYTEQK